ncbi:uncharacterized protein IUM83_09419 [Phytophthora cinnamomi]|uniref:uncharacterized protein n=1 Tax=Phytophthora cinnamomi TaxID=4785 RepID=UPI00355A7C58|nr:hypothetical protein IUM83_09419 [Phytophthora cinnamomi]
MTFVVPSLVVLVATTLQIVNAHTWIDCLDTDRSKLYDQSASYIFGGAAGNGFCGGYGAGYPGRGVAGIGTEFTYKLLRNEFEAGAPVCGAVGDNTYKDWRKRLSVTAGQPAYFAYLPNGHIVKDKKGVGTQHGVYWTGKVGTSLTSTHEIKNENLVDGHTLNYDDGNCGETFDFNGNPSHRAGDGKPCIGSFVVPAGTAPGIYKMVWFWTFWLDNQAAYVDQAMAKGYFGAAYSTCFEVEVTSSGSVANTAAPNATAKASGGPAAPATPAAATPVTATGTPADATPNTDKTPEASTAAIYKARVAAEFARLKGGGSSLASVHAAGSSSGSLDLAEVTVGSTTDESKKSGKIEAVDTLTSNSALENERLQNEIAQWRREVEHARDEKLELEASFRRLDQEIGNGYHLAERKEKEIRIAELVTKNQKMSQLLERELQSLDAVRRAHTELQTENRKLTEQVTVLNQVLDSVETKHAELSDSHATLTASYEAAQTTIETLQCEVHVLQDKLSASDQHVQVVAEYEEKIQHWERICRELELKYEHKAQKFTQLQKIASASQQEAQRALDRQEELEQEVRKVHDQMIQTNAAMRTMEAKLETNLKSAQHSGSQESLHRRIRHLEGELLQKSRANADLMQSCNHLLGSQKRSGTNKTALSSRNNHAMASRVAKLTTRIASLTDKLRSTEEARDRKSRSVDVLMQAFPFLLHRLDALQDQFAAAVESNDIIKNALEQIQDPPVAMSSHTALLELLAEDDALPDVEELVLFEFSFEFELLLDIEEPALFGLLFEDDALLEPEELMLAG